MTYRIANLIGFLICLSLIGAALYFQHVDGLEPCPLCIFQRVAFSILGIVFLLAFLLNPINMGRKIFALFMLIAGIFGTIVGGRHLWLQSLPADQVPTCGPGLNYMLEVFSFGEVINKVFSGSGECAEVDWVFMGLSMPAWGVLWIIALTIFGLWATFNTKTTAKSQSPY